MPEMCRAFPACQAKMPYKHMKIKKKLKSGDPGWIRTIDLPLRRRPLYPLSYEAPVWRCPTWYMRANAPPCKQFDQQPHGVAVMATDLGLLWRVLA